MDILRAALMVPVCGFSGALALWLGHLWNVVAGAGGAALVGVLCGMTLWILDRAGRRGERKVRPAPPGRHRA